MPSSSISDEDGLIIRRHQDTKRRYTHWNRRDHRLRGYVDYGHDIAFAQGNIKPLAIRGDGEPRDLRIPGELCRLGKTLEEIPGVGIGAQLGFSFGQSERFVALRCRAQIVDHE